MEKYLNSLKQIEEAYRVTPTEETKEYLKKALIGIIMVATNDNEINFSDFFDESLKTADFLETWANT